MRSACFDHTGQVAERSKAADCKSAPSGFGGSNPPLPTLFRSAALRCGDLPPQRRRAYRDHSGSSSDGRASAFQAEGRGFESRLPLQRAHVRSGRLSSVVERFHGKEGVIGSNPIGGSCDAAPLFAYCESIGEYAAAVHTGVAQLAEQRSPKPQAAGSSPAARARNTHGALRRNPNRL